MHPLQGDFITQSVTSEQANTNHNFSIFLLNFISRTACELCSHSHSHWYAPLSKVSGIYL